MSNLEKKKNEYVSFFILTCQKEGGKRQNLAGCLDQ